jgi:ankyrin repeat protein
MNSIAELQPGDVEAILKRCGAAGINQWIGYGFGEYGGATPLWVASRVGSLAMVKLLIKGGANVNMRCHSTQIVLVSKHVG